MNLNFIELLTILQLITRAHSFPRKNLTNSAENLVNSAENLENSAADRGKADEIPRLTAATQLNFRGLIDEIMNQQVKYMLCTYESLIIRSLIINFIIQPSPSNKKSS